MPTTKRPIVVVNDTYLGPIETTVDTEEAFHIDRYYTSQDYFQQRFDRLHRQMGFAATTLDDFSAWKALLRRELSSLIGTATMTPCDPSPRLLERVELDGYTREKMLMQTESGIFMPFYVLIPENVSPGERRAPVLAPHGHGSGGKFAPSGRSDLPGMAGVIRGCEYDYGLSLVNAGFIVFCPDARGFGERREDALQGDSFERFFSASCAALNHMALPLGQTVTGMWTWDLMRLIDYIATRPDCDISRLGSAGLSGGGLQTLWLAAMDDRVQCAVVSGYFYGYRESLLTMNMNCSCNYVPHLWEKVDMGDLSALIAPRPLLIETGTEDALNSRLGIDNVLPQVDIARGAYALFDAGDRLYHDLFPGKHCWHGVKAIPWLQRHLQ